MFAKDASKLTIDKAMELALNNEAASKNTAMVRNVGSTSRVAYVQANTNVTCYCCGAKGHFKTDCKYRTYKCESCNKTGHLKAVCKSKNEKTISPSAVRVKLGIVTGK